MVYCNRFEILGEITVNEEYGYCSKYPNYLFYRNGDIFNIKKKRMLCKNKTVNNYEYCTLYSKNNENKSIKFMIYVHRLMYLLFVDDIDDGMEIDHINHIRDDNNINNLRCITKAENRRNRRINNNNYSENDKKHNDKYKIYYHNYYLNKKIC